MDILAVEYPGYGVYKSFEPSEELVLRDSERILQFAVETLHVPLDKILILGRSIGSGPATHLAARNRIAALMLISPFTSLKAVVKDLIGSWAQGIVKDRFNNLAQMKDLKCPLMLIHGESDTFIPHSHSQALFGTPDSNLETLVQRSARSTSTRR